MASKRRLRRKGCVTKFRYGTMREASSEAFKARERGAGNVWPYGCPFCNGFHVGHRPEYVEKKIAERFGM